MIRVIVLDTGPIGLITNPKLSNQGIACNKWLQSHLQSGNRIILPEIADYEVRRELLWENKTKGLSRLEQLAKLIEYLPIKTAAIFKPPFFGQKLASQDSQQQRTKQLMAI